MSVKMLLLAYLNAQQFEKRKGRERERETHRGKTGRGGEEGGGGEAEFTEDQ